MKLFSLSNNRILGGIHKIEDFSNKLSLAEKEIILGCNEKRIKEFSTSRWLAKKLLTRLNYKTTNILPNEFGAPIWPKGVAGSISHSNDLCIVAVSANSGHSIGIDLQKITTIRPEFTDLVLTPKEKFQNKTESEEEFIITTNMIFSIKESIYKCLGHCKSIDLDFHDVETYHQCGKFNAKIKKSNSEFEGIYRIFQDYIFTGLQTKHKQ
ncbi:MAG: 4'-phosphopantetheinyl transferase [Flavobacteriales bacterium]